MTFALHAQLATWRARTGPSEEQCLALFGIGRETLQRIESAEIEPEPEIIERIETELLLSGDICFGGGSPLPPPLPGRRLSHSGGPPGGGAAVTGSAASFAQPNRRAL